MGWFSGDNHISNYIAVDEVKLIAVVLIVIVALLVCFFLFKAYHSHIKSHVKNVTVREVALNNVCTK